ncbi:hydrolase [Dechloromonas denitrificans]|uniref:hydrolase n=1 Tax=Dechloromonas denitrificans TaxID=281362 RepID=UPI001CF91BBD|nr:hydrolase [Dechloromonas denitrificans]UCV03752.1 hydrolase [Dechloromonas denitrificans]UCV08015.1 hydrolase [Dechloromonas denitrificans]
MLIRRDRSLLLLVDIQQKLAPAIFAGDAAIANNVRLLAGARQLGIPRFVSEQYVRGLGASVAAIRDAAGDARFFEKMHFSCTGEPGVIEMLRATGRRQVILTGMETHVCVLQSAFGLIEAGFTVFLVADAASSRTAENRSAAIERMQAGGVHIVTTEMVLFEWLQQAGTDEFRALLPLIK